MLRKSYSASGSEDEGDGASKYCNVCHTAIDVSQTFCANCGASNKHEGSLGSSNSSGQSGEVVVPGSVKRKPSITPPASITHMLGDRQKNCSSGSLQPQARRMPLSANSSTDKLMAADMRRDTGGLSNHQLLEIILEMQQTMHCMQEQLQDQARARYKQSQLLTRVVEDLLKMKGMDMTDDTLEKQLRVATNFLDNIAVKFKIDYDLVEFGDQFATGGFSDVYDGVYEDKKIAIKHVRVDALNPDDYFLELEKEVQLLSELDHPNVLHFVGVCVWPSYYIITEFMDGGTLSHVLHDESVELSWSVRQHILMQIAAALHYLHYLNPAVIHLDLKPLNILMGARSGDSWIAKLSDFGLSVRKQNLVSTRAVEKKMTGFKAMNAVTQSGMIPTFLPGMSSPMGTPLHIAPEVAAKLPFNEKADIYAFGMLIWEVIARRKLHSLQEDKADLNSEVKPPIDETVPKELRDLMLQCWKKNQWERPSIGAVLEVVHNVSADENFCTK